MVNEMSRPTPGGVGARSLCAASALAVMLLASCRRDSPVERSAPGADAPLPGVAPTDRPTGAPVAPVVAGVNVVGPVGLAAWDALAAAEKARLKASPIVYLHQSVGQDLEDGAEELGWKFAYYGKGASSVEPGPNGGLFNDVGPIDNGLPLEKLALVRAVAERHRGRLKAIAFSFGYADVRDEDLARVEAEYLRTATAVRATGARFVHVTPPLVFDAAENGPKMKMRTWMLSAFPGDIIFDLQDIESQDEGKRCEVGGVWRICQANRSTRSCPSKGQGVDSDGQGHLCSRKAASFARGLLYSLALASR